MKNIIVTSIAMGVFAVCTAHANTITPTASSFASGISVTYDANLSSGEIHSGDGFTIFDIGGFTSVISVPAGWVSSTSVTGSPWGVAPVGADSSAINVTFTYTGASMEAAFAIVPFAPFVVGTTGTFLVTDDWTSRDHLLGDVGIIDGSLATPHTDQILVPGVASVPDGGSMIAMLGMAVLGLGALRRKLQ